MDSVLPQIPTLELPRPRLLDDTSAEPTWGMTAPSMSRTGPMAAARAAVPLSPGDGASLLDGFVSTEGLLLAAADTAAARHAALAASARCWYRLGHTPARLASDLADSARTARAWRVFAGEVRALGITVAAARALAQSALQESDALRRYLEAEGLGTLQGGRFCLFGAAVERDLAAVRLAFQCAGFRSDRSSSLRGAERWAAAQVVRIEGATRGLLSTLTAARGAEASASLCDRLADLVARATSAVLGPATEEPFAASGLASGVEHFPYSERLTSLGRRLAAVQALDLSCSPALDPRATVAAFSGALGALRGARLVLPCMLDEYANRFENLGNSVDRAASAPPAQRAAAACAHLARLQVTHAALAGLQGPLAAQQDAVADARERLLAFACGRSGRVSRRQLPEPVAAVDLFYFSVTRGLAHLAADLDVRRSELAAAARAFAALLDQTR